MNLVKLGYYTIGSEHDKACNCRTGRFLSPQLNLALFCNNLISWAIFEKWMISNIRLILRIFDIFSVSQCEEFFNPLNFSQIVLYGFRFLYVLSMLFLLFLSIKIRICLFNLTYFSLSTRSLNLMLYSERKLVYIKISSK